MSSRRFPMRYRGDRQSQPRCRFVRKCCLSDLARERGASPHQSRKLLLIPCNVKSGNIFSIRRRTPISLNGSDPRPANTCALPLTCGRLSTISMHRSERGLRVACGSSSSWREPSTSSPAGRTLPNGRARLIASQCSQNCQLKQPCDESLAGLASSPMNFGMSL